MQTISELRQKLQQISDTFEQLSCEPAFQELCKHTQQMCDVSLADSWQGIESAINLLNQQYSPSASQKN